MAIHQTAKSMSFGIRLTGSNSTHSPHGLGPYAKTCNFQDPGSSNILWEQLYGNMIKPAWHV